MSTYNEMLKTYRKLLKKIKVLQFKNFALKQEILTLRKELEIKKRIINEINEEINRDPLTNILNRRGIHAKLNETGEIPYSLIMCDIDNFKGINDTYGHSIGDQVLQMISEVIKGAIREEDNVARIGGDEWLSY